MVKPRQYIRLEALSDNSAVQRDTILNFSGQSVAMRVARMQKSRGEKSISVHNGVKSPFDDVCMEMKLKELKSFAGLFFRYHHDNNF